ncbi:hypothetical protein D9758_004098 [Tetrapyrgos nigripes]|uniref:Chitin deacetylase n=1 Tax=Tetrapyrgos nigripes TaxID=182062 RepID=A0A8H5LVQ8_9AGAR|nr:hypothetical protein D9758_004098 [Tetrapyrgos nigripes]
MPLLGKLCYADFYPLFFFYLWRISHDMAMTYDDGPYIHTTNVSSNLLAENAQGTFFMNGDNYGCIYDQANVDIVKQVFAAGHEIGHHTWSHPFMDQLTNDQIDVEIMRLDQAFIKILGVKPNILRPPYGAITNDQVAYIENKHGKKVVTWDQDSEDSVGKNTREEILAFYQGIANSYSTAPQFTLGHDTLDQTGTTALEAAQMLTSAGYKLITTAKCLNVEPYTYVGQPQKRDSSWYCGGSWDVSMYSEQAGSGSTSTTTSGSGSTSVSTGSSTSTSSGTQSTGTSGSSQCSYTVVSGDFCYTIAGKNHITLDQLLAANPGVDCNVLGPTTSTITSSGSSTTGICSPTTYTSVQDDTCDSIAVKFGTTSAQILKDNGFLTCNDIWAWTPIKITCNSGVATTAATTTVGTTTTATTSSGSQATGTCSPTTYTSVQGDTCDSIAVHFGTTAAQVLADNNWAWTPIKITCNSAVATTIATTATTATTTSSSAQATGICSPTTYTSVQGDTCDSIAVKFGTTSAQILKDNAFLSCNDIAHLTDEISFSWAWTPITITCSSAAATTIATTATTATTTSSSAQATGICSPTTYTSVQGDTCNSIAVKFGTTSAQILKDNAFLSCNDIAHLTDEISFSWAWTPITITCSSAAATTIATTATTATTTSSSAQATGICSPTTYTSVQGDTCNSIAVKFGTTSAQVLADNNWAWTPIKITCSSASSTKPACSSNYISKAGDDCASIGAQFGVSAAAILGANR